MFNALSTIGLLIDLVGAVLIAWDIWTLGDRTPLKTRVARVSGEHLLERDTALVVHGERRQRGLTRWGVALLALGFLLQLIGSAGGHTAAAALYLAAPSFWTIFWAVLLAVFVAQLAAVPLGMWAWAWYTDRPGWRAQSGATPGASVCLAHLRRALETNIKAGSWYHEQPLAGRSRNHGLEIDSASWHAFRHELVSCLNDDVQLRIDLAGYFADIDEFNRAHQEYLQMCAQDHLPSEAEQSRIVTRVQRLAYQAVVGGTDLLDRVAALSQRLDRTAGGS